MRRLELRPGFVALACLSYYLWPGRVFRAWALLCAIHEMGHLAALALCGVRVERVRLRALGAEIEEQPEGLVICGKPRLRGGRVDSAGDHRIAMSAAVAATVCTEEVCVDGADCVRKSYPRFWEDFDALGGGRA